MNYLLDTCVISEYTRREPNINIIRWIDKIDETNIFLSAITIGEIKKGIELLPDDSGRKRALTQWLNDTLLERFARRIFPVTVEVMLCWGSIYARLETSGKTVSTMDSLIAATATLHHAILVTRNEDHFQPTGVEMINPWKLI
jgi:toxin FitB